MAIPAKQSTVIPAKTEEVYNSWWIKRLELIAKDNTTGSLRLHLAPYNEETGVINEDTTTHKMIHLNLWELLTSVPKALTAMGVIFEAIPDIEIFHDTKYPERANSEFI